MEYGDMELRPVDDLPETKYRKDIAGNTGDFHFISLNGHDLSVLITEQNISCPALNLKGANLLAKFVFTENHTPKHNCVILNDFNTQSMDICTSRCTYTVRGYDQRPNMVELYSCRCPPILYITQAQWNKITALDIEEFKNNLCSHFAKSGIINLSTKKRHHLSNL
jgi:hypothetical protein